MNFSLLKLLKIVIIWRILFFVAAFFIVQLPIQFGAKFPYADTELMTTGLPEWIWTFANFDGVHYLKLAKFGYLDQFTQAFFPLYPLLINTFSFQSYYLLSGIFLSFISLLAAVYVLYKLFLLDYSPKISFMACIFLLLFPTAFYFSAMYTESLFIFLAALSFYLMRKGNFLLSGLFIALATATKIIGVFLVFAILVEVFLSYKNRDLTNINLFKALLGILIAPLGLILYMTYLDVNFNNPIYFFTAQSHFGAERTGDSLILLPQVLFRYAKILLTVPVFTLTYFNAFLELIFTAIPLVFIALNYKKIRPSYLLFIVGCLILPTLTGTLSSMPRYVLMAFLVLPVFVTYIERRFILVGILMVILQLLLFGFFIKGYWIA